MKLSNVLCIYERIIKSMPDFPSSTSLFWTTTDGGNDNSSTAILDVAEYLMTYLGQRYRSTVTAVSLSIVYGLVLMTGVLGNVVTCVVIARNGYMHTATNYYLFSLAISDMLFTTTAVIIIIIIIIIINDNNNNNNNNNTISDVLSLVFGKQIIGFRWAYQAVLSQRSPRDAPYVWADTLKIFRSP